jgi:hypothetical protein
MLVCKGTMDRCRWEADWAEGNGLVVILSGSGKRVAEAYDGSPAGAPLLHVEFHTGD